MGNKPIDINETIRVGQPLVISRPSDVPTTEETVVGNNTTIDSIVKGGYTLIYSARILAYYNNLKSTTDTIAAKTRIKIPHWMIRSSKVDKLTLEAYPIAQEETLVSLAKAYGLTLEALTKANIEAFSKLWLVDLNEAQVGQFVDIIKDRKIPKGTAINLPRHSLRQQFEGYSPQDRQLYIQYIKEARLDKGTDYEQELRWAAMDEEVKSLPYLRYVMPLHADSRYISEVTGASFQAILPLNTHKQVTTGQTRVHVGKIQTEDWIQQNAHKEGAWRTVSSFVYNGQSSNPAANAIRLPYKQTNHNFNGWSRLPAAPQAAEGHFSLYTCQTMDERKERDHVILAIAPVVKNAPNLHQAMAAYIKRYKEASKDIKQNKGGVINRNKIDIALYTLKNDESGILALKQLVNQKAANAKFSNQSLYDRAVKARMFTYDAGSIVELSGVGWIPNNTNSNQLTHWDYLQRQSGQNKKKQVPEKDPYAPHAQRIERGLGMSNFMDTQTKSIQLTLGLQGGIKLNNKLLNKLYKYVPWVKKLKLKAMVSFATGISGTLSVEDDRKLRTQLKWHWDVGAEVELFDGWIKNETNFGGALGLGILGGNRTFASARHLSTHIVHAYYTLVYSFVEWLKKFGLDENSLPPNIQDDLRNYKNYIKDKPTIGTVPSTYSNQTEYPRIGLEWGVAGTQQINETVTAKKDGKAARVAAKTGEVVKVKFRYLALTATYFELKNDANPDNDGKYRNVQIFVNGSKEIVIPQLKSKQIQQLIHKVVRNVSKVSKNSWLDLLKNVYQVMTKVPPNFLEVGAVGEWNFIKDTDAYTLQYFRISTQTNLQVGTKDVPVVGIKPFMEIGVEGKGSVYEYLGDSTLTYLSTLYNSIRARWGGNKLEQQRKEAAARDLLSRSNGRSAIGRMIHQMGQTGSPLQKRTLAALSNYQNAKIFVQECERLATKQGGMVRLRLKFVTHILDPLYEEWKKKAY